jgi:hypothetical protein
VTGITVWRFALEGCGLALPKDRGRNCFSIDFKEVGKKRQGRLTLEHKVNYVLSSFFWGEAQ